MTRRLFAAAALLLATTAAAAAEPPLPPARYAKLFNAVSGDVNAFAATAPLCPGNTTHPMIVGEIGAADSNFLQRSLPAADATQMQAMVQAAIADAAAAAHLDIFDLHAYQPDYLSEAIADLDYLVAQGKAISMSETWDNKISAAAPIKLPPGWTPPDLQQVLNGYSFWEAVDAAYLPAIYANLDCRGAVYVDFWHSPQLSAYVDFTPQTAQYDATQMRQALNAAVKQSVANGTISRTGAALRKLTGIGR